MNSLGLKTGSALQQLLTLLKVLLLLALVGAAFAYTGVTSGPALPVGPQLDAKFKAMLSQYSVASGALQ